MAVQDAEHAARTRYNGYRYIFTARHHGGDKSGAMWLTEIDRDTEFSIFDLSDVRQIADSRGWLYGVLRDGDELREIGTCDEQVAEFQPGRVGEPWHGYPKWVANEAGPANRRKPHCRPDKQVFDRMVEVALITAIQRKRFLAGRHA